MTSMPPCSAGNFPAVSFLKAPAYQDGHAGYSDPLDEQAWITKVVNFLERQPEWRDTAVIIAWDDSDGWYDHAFATTRRARRSTIRPTSSTEPASAARARQPCGLLGKPVNGRCGPGTRMPFLVISPWARANYVSHAYVSQASIARFIEDNWLHGRAPGRRRVRCDDGKHHGHVRLLAASSESAAFPETSSR